MKERLIIFNPAVNPNTFVFLNQESDCSCSIRDFSRPGPAKLSHPDDYGQSAQSIRETAEFAFLVRPHNISVKNHEWWHRETLRLNEQYLDGTGDTGDASTVGRSDATQRLLAQEQAAPALPPHSAYQSITRGLASFYVPTSTTDDWRLRLADPDGHWRDGYSAKLTADRWEAAHGFPAEVAAVLGKSQPFKGIEFLCGFPEHKVPLPGGGHPSQNDIFVLARTPDSLAAIAVEAKVGESFGPMLAEWLVNASRGKTTRLRFLRDALGLPDKVPGDIRYQLLHRAGSAVKEAWRFHARHAVLLVHSFSAANSGFEDYARFVSIYGRQAAIDSVVTLKQLDGVTLHTCWVRG